MKINILTGILIFFTFVFIFFMIRNFMVFNARTRVANEISEHNKRCIENDTYDSDQLKYPELSGDTLTYEKMLIKFWKPVNQLEKELRINLGLK